MRTTYVPARSDGATARFELHIGGESFAVVTESGSITVAAGGVPSPDAVIWSGAAMIPHSSTCGGAGMSWTAGAGCV